VKNLTQRRGERRETQRSLGGIYLCAPLRSPRLCVIFFVQRIAGTAANLMLELRPYVLHFPLSESILVYI
jgi:hypothetical protein